MNFRTIRAAMAGWAIVLVLQTSPAHGDEITIGDVTHKDVLVYEGAAIYYVKFPKDGRIVNVLEKDVAPGAVVISEDPFQRDELKAKFETMKEKRDAAIREAGGTLPADSPFNTAIEGDSGAVDTAALLGKGRSAGKGMGIPRAMLVQVLSGAGFKFGAPSGSGVTGKSADGKASIELQGPEGNLTGMVTTVTLSATQAPIALQQMSMQMTPLVPWIGEFLASEQPNLLKGMTVERTQEGRYVSVAPTQSGREVTIVFTVRGA